jgi:acyl-CoA hydrolase
VFLHTTLQLGIGHLPAAVLSHLGGHRNLGIHSEMLGDEVLPLVESGVVNNSMKRLDRGKMVATFLMGSQALYGEDLDGSIYRCCKCMLVFIWSSNVNTVQMHW